MDVQPQKSVYRYAAGAGRWLGLYLTAAAFCFLLGNRFPQLPLLSVPLLLGVPFVMLLLMKPVVKETPQYLRFSPLWLFGIYTFIFASLICALFMALYLMFIEPHFITTSLANAAASIRAAGLESQFAEQLSVIDMALSRGAVPSPMQLVAAMAWTTCFGGSVLSMALAWIVTLGGRNKAFQQ